MEDAIPLTDTPLFNVFTSVTDPRHAGKVLHPLPEVLAVAICGVLVGVYTFEEIELWAKEKLPWLRQYFSLPNGVPSHDTFARLFGLMDPYELEADFRRWIESVLPSVSPQVVALDGVRPADGQPKPVQRLYTSSAALRPMQVSSLDSRQLPRNQTK